jgi:hypothetical protein
MKVEFADGSDEKAVMENVVKACKRVEDDCETQEEKESRRSQTCIQHQRYSGTS